MIWVLLISIFVQTEYTENKLICRNTKHIAGVYSSENECFKAGHQFITNSVSPVTVLITAECQREGIK